MEIGIIGLPGSGKSAIFSALTGGRVGHAPAGTGKVEANLGVAKVADDRLQRLAAMFNPKKITPAEVKYVDLAGVSRPRGESRGLGEDFINHIRNADALALVLRVFSGLAGEEPDPLRDLGDVIADLIITDLSIIEKRLERLEKDRKKGLKEAEEEAALLTRCRESLEGEAPIRGMELNPQEEKLLRGYQFLSGKPLLLVLNMDERDIGNEDREGDERLRERAGRIRVGLTRICGKLEMELSQLDEEEARAFMEDMGLAEMASVRAIRASYELLRLISFFTVVSDEVRAWTIQSGTPAAKAAGAVHTDMEKGFIRAEVVSFDHLMECGSMAAARDRGLLRTEGKDYVVQDGDVINFKFRPPT